LSAADFDISCGEMPGGRDRRITYKRTPINSSLNAMNPAAIIWRKLSGRLVMEF
jgi:hypothetical protein